MLNQLCLILLVFKKDLRLLHNFLYLQDLQQQADFLLLIHISISLQQELLDFSRNSPFHICSLLLLKDWAVNTQFYLMILYHQTHPPLSVPSHICGILQVPHLSLPLFLHLACSSKLLPFPNMGHCILRVLSSYFYLILTHYYSNLKIRSMVGPNRTFSLSFYKHWDQELVCCSEHLGSFTFADKMNFCWSFLKTPISVF